MNDDSEIVVLLQSGGAFAQRRSASVQVGFSLLRLPRGAGRSWKVSHVGSLCANQPTLGHVRHRCQLNDRFISKWSWLNAQALRFCPPCVSGVPRPGFAKLAGFSFGRP